MSARRTKPYTVANGIHIEIENAVNDCLMIGVDVTVDGNNEKTAVVPRFLS